MPTKNRKLTSDYEAYVYKSYPWHLNLVHYNRVFKYLVFILGHIGTIGAIVVISRQILTKGELNFANLEFICVFLISVDLFVRFFRAPSILAFIRRYWSDILGVLPVLIVLPILLYRGDSGELWTSSGDTNHLSNVLIHACATAPMLRLVRLLSDAFEGYRKYSRLSYESLSGFIQPAIIVSALSLTTIALATVVVYDMDKNPPNKEVADPNKEVADPNKEVADSPLVADRGDSAYRVILAFMDGGSDDHREFTMTSRTFYLLIIVVGGIVFSLATSVVPAVSSSLLKFAPADRWKIPNLKDHFVICGHNETILPMIQDLATTPGFKHKPFVFITEGNAPPYFEDIPLPSDQIYHVEGDFTRRDILVRAGIKKARYAIIVADDSESHPRGDRDTRAVFASLSVEYIRNGIITITERLSSIHHSLLQAENVEATINRRELSGHALALACQYPSQTRILRDMLTYREGISLELDLTSLKDLANNGSDLNVPDVIEHFREKESATFLGVIRHTAQEDDDEAYKNQNIIFATSIKGVLSQDDAAIVLKTAHSNTNSKEKKTIRAVRHDADIDVEAPIVILGWSSAGKELLDELAAAKELGQLSSNKITIISPHIPQSERDAKEKYSNINLDVSFVPQDYVAIENITKYLDEAGRIIILGISSTSQIHPDYDIVTSVRALKSSDRDARTVFSALAIYNRYKGQTDRLRPHIVVELMSQDSERIFERTDIEAILRNRLSGGAIAAACRHPRLVDVPQGLIKIRNGHRLSTIKQEKRQYYNFDDTSTETQVFGHVAKGYFEAGYILIGYEYEMQTKDETEGMVIPLSHGGHSENTWLKQRLNPPSDAEIPSRASLLVILPAKGRIDTLS